MSMQPFSHMLFIGLVSCFMPAPALSQTSSPSGADSQIVGKWEWSLDVGPSKGKASVAIAESDGKLVGEVTAPDQQVLKAEDLNFQKDHISFSISRDMGIVQIVMSYKGKLEGNEIIGTFHMKGGPMRKSGKWHAKRVESK